jgi:outer membrane protein assembly factor BamB
VGASAPGGDLEPERGLAAVGVPGPDRALIVGVGRGALVGWAPLRDEVRWRVALHAPVERLEGAGGRAYVLGAERQIAAVDAGRGHVDAVARLPAALAPALPLLDVDGPSRPHAGVFAASRGHVHVLDRATLAPRATWRLGGAARVFRAAGARVVVGPAPDGGLLALASDPETPPVVVRGAFAAEGGVSVDDDALYVVGPGRQVAFDLASGAERWATAAPELGPPASTRGRLVVPAEGRARVLPDDAVVELPPGRPTAAVAAAGFAVVGVGAQLLGLDTRRARVAWTLEAPGVARDLVTDGRVVVGRFERSGCAALAALLPARGRFLWTAALPDGAGAARLRIVGGMLVVRHGRGRALLRVDRGSLLGSA